MERGRRCTRSQAAPDWSVQECLILVNEINAIEGEWSHTLASFQKWQLVVENCNALDVNRSLNQCKRKWESLLNHYNQIKPYESAYWGFDVSKRSQLGLPHNFSAEIFQAVDKYVTTTVMRDEDSGAAVGPDSDRDSDPEAHLEDAPHDVVSRTGSRKQHKRAISQKRKVDEKLNPWRYATGRNVKHKRHSLNGTMEPPESQTIRKVKPETSSVQYNLDERVDPRRSGTVEKLKVELSSIDHHNLDERVEPPKSWIVGKLYPEPSILAGEDDQMAANLLENARMINAVLNGNLGEDVDCKLADLKNSLANRYDFTRLQGDKLIHYLGKFADTLNQLCDNLQECN